MPYSRSEHCPFAASRTQGLWQSRPDSDLFGSGHLEDVAHERCGDHKLICQLARLRPDLSQDNPAASPTAFEEYAEHLRRHWHSATSRQVVY